MKQSIHPNDPCSTCARRLRAPATVKRGPQSDGELLEIEGLPSSQRRACSAPVMPDCVRPGDSGCDTMESRRDFVRGTVAAFAALFVAGTIAPADLSALPIQFTSGRSRGRALTYPIPPADGAVIDRDNEIILVRWQAQLYAFALSCPHQRSMLKWRDKEQRFQCTKHKSKYQPDGAYVSGRATRGMDRHPLRIAGDSVEVDTSIKIEQDQDPTAWDAAVADLA